MFHSANCSSKLKHISFICALLILLILLSGCSRRCEIKGCNESVWKSESEKSIYCYVHTCLEDDCWNSVIFPSENTGYSFASGHEWYCDEHANRDFDISNVKLSVNDSIATISGTISNVGNTDYYQVWIYGTFYGSDEILHENTYIAPLNVGDNADFEITIKVSQKITGGHVYFDNAVVGTAGDTDWVEIKDSRLWMIDSE